MQGYSYGIITLLQLQVLIQSSSGIQKKVILKGAFRNLTGETEVKPTNLVNADNAVESRTGYIADGGPTVAVTGEQQKCY
jgi:hypothetical protein